MKNPQNQTKTFSSKSNSRNRVQKSRKNRKIIFEISAFDASGKNSCAGEKIEALYKTKSYRKKNRSIS